MYLTEKNKNNTTKQASGVPISTLAQKSSSPAPPAGPHKLMRPKNHAPDRCPALTCLQSPDPHQRRAISCPSCPAAGRRLALRLLPGQPAGHLAPDAAALPGQRPEKGGQRRPSARPAGCRDSASRAASSHRALGSTAAGAPHLHGGRRQPSCV